MTGEVLGQQLHRPALVRFGPDPVRGRPFGHRDRLVAACDGHVADGAQPRRLTGVRLGHVPDLAGAQQPVGVKVAAVVSGERLGQDNRGNLGGPNPAAGGSTFFTPITIGYHRR